jgi:hypothetical protein
MEHKLAIAFFCLDRGEPEPAALIEQAFGIEMNDRLAGSLAVAIRPMREMIRNPGPLPGDERLATGGTDKPQAAPFATSETCRMTLSPSSPKASLIPSSDQRPSGSAHSSCAKGLSFSSCIAKPEESPRPNRLAATIAVIFGRICNRLGVYSRGR